MKNSILVTGGAGFIGSSLCERLVNKNINVICIDNFDNFYDPGIKHRNLESLITKNNFKLICGDIRDSATLEKIFLENEITFVIHLAAKAGVRPSIAEPELYFDVNLNGTVNLLEAMRKSNIKKMIYASSSSVYGNSNMVPFIENDACDHPISPYAASKRSSELICHTYHYLFNMDIFCLRFFTVYGPKQRPDLAIHKFTNYIFEGKRIPFYGDGTTKRDYTFIDDIIDGIILAIDKVSGFEIINLGESKTIMLKELLQNLEEIIGKKALIEKLPLQQGDVNLTYADLSKAKKILGYSPKWNIHDGLTKFINWKKKDHN